MCGHTQPAGVGELTEEKPRRLALDLVTDGLLRGENPSRWSPDGAVVEIRDGGIEHPLRPERGTEAGHWATVTNRLTLGGVVSERRSGSACDAVHEHAVAVDGCRLAGESQMLEVREGLALGHVAP